MQFHNDLLYANPLGEITHFKFDASVVNVFLDMMRRSVPNNGVIISAVDLLVGRFRISSKITSRNHDVTRQIGRAESVEACTVCRSHDVDCSRGGVSLGYA